MAAYISRSFLVYVTPFRSRLNLLPNGVTLASTNNVLPEDGVTASKHVGAVLM